MADSPGNIGVTSDPQKVKPGMIYVDLSEKRNKRQVYEAYSNGASMIFTAFNISDPELPVIKVRSPKDTLYMLVDRYLRKQMHQGKLVAVLGDGGKSVLLEMIQGILCSKSDMERLKDWSKCGLGNLRNIDGFLESFFEMSNCGMDIIPINIDSNPEGILYFSNMNIDCAIITNKASNEGREELNSARDYISGLMKKRAVIINNDEYSESRITEEYRDIECITYGLNKKSIITASSIDVDELTCFNYCVQRSFHTRSGIRVEPFEIPVRLNTLGTRNIYNALAAITCGLYYDKDVIEVKTSIESYKAPERYFQKIYDGVFTVIDNYCSSIRDYAAAFDSIQILNYENLILVIAVSEGENTAFYEGKARLITEWAKMLKCKEVILTSCMDGNHHVEELPLKSIRVYKRIFRENEIAFRYYHLLQHSLERGLSIIDKRGLMVILGGDEMNAAHRIIERQLRTLVHIRH